MFSVVGPGWSANNVSGNTENMQPMMMEQELASEDEEEEERVDVSINYSRGANSFRDKNTYIPYRIDNVSNSIFVSQTGKRAKIGRNQVRELYWLGNTIGVLIG